MDHLNQDLAPETEVTRVAPSLAPSFEKQNTFSLADKDRKYSRQYFSMYQHRLAMLKPRVDREAKRKWGHNTRRVNGQMIQHKEKILDIVSGELCWALGTVFADMKHKLNIFSDVEKGTDDVLPTPPERYVAPGEEAVLMLEDDSGRAILHNEELLQRAGLVTGCFVGVLGIEIQAGVFEVMELAYPVPAPQNALVPAVEDRWVAFVSGLRFDRETAVDLRALLLLQWLLGELGGAADEHAAQRVSQVVVMGGSVAEIAAAPNADFTTTNNFGLKNVLHFLLELVELFGRWLADVLALVPVVVMPGETDPVEMCLPQQPMHRSLFGASAPVVGLAVYAATNPTWLELDGLRTLATSGQNIGDMLKYDLTDGSADDVLNAMSRTLRWQNVAPTAPDTLYCYPYDDWDPFTLDETPHLYVVGNQREAGHRETPLKCGPVTLVCVPSFHDTGKVMMVNTRTREVKVADFGA